MLIKKEDGTDIEIEIVKEDNIYAYYLDGKKFGVYAPKTMTDKILILQNTIENELGATIKEQVNNLNREEIEREAGEQDRLGDYARAIGVDEKDIVREEKTKDIAEDKKGKEDKQEKQEAENDLETEDSKGEKVPIKQIIETTDMANYSEDVGTSLGISKSEYPKIGVIESDDRDKLKDENGEAYDRTSTRYSVVAIGKDEKSGEEKAVPIETLVTDFKQRDSAGNNPTKEEYHVGEKGDVEKDSVLSEYEFNGGNTLSIENGQYGEIVVNRGHEATGSTADVKTQVETGTIRDKIDTEVRKLHDKYESNGIYNTDEMANEAEQHGDEEITTKEIDGDPNTGKYCEGMAIDDYVPGTDVTWRAFASRCGYRHESEITKLQKEYDDEMRDEFERGELKKDPYVRMEEFVVRKEEEMRSPTIEQ